MNQLEKIALEKLKNEIQDILDKSHESKAETFQHCRIYLLWHAQRAMQIVKALEENQTKHP